MAMARSSGPDVATGETMHEAEVLDERDYFSSIRLWGPVPASIKTRAWLENFKPKERQHAVALLNSFVYLNSEVTDKLFVSAFSGLAQMVSKDAGTYADKKLEWNEFRRGVLITHPTGETPNATDSGFLFDRKARQLLDINEDHIMLPEEVLTTLLLRGPRPVVFVDDFAGSGDQFTKTWNRSYSLSTGDVVSFSQLSAAGQLGSTYYAPSICTSYAAERIRECAPRLILQAAHILSPRYGASDEHTLLFPPHLRADALQVISDASRRAGIMAHQILGYHDLGLALAFEHSVPDAALPIFWMSTANWTPLLRRR